jgi:hypothetical protein
LAKFPGIPEPTQDPEAMMATVQALKQATETILGQRRGSRVTSAVTWQDLVDLGLIEVEQIPRD